MKGYIYITGTGVDPMLRGNLADPTFGEPPTLGPCMPNIRRAVAIGDWIFIVSGKVTGARQYVIGGLQVAEKIDAWTAYARFPENRLVAANDGRVTGNIIVQADGKHHPLDWHSDFRFEERARNFVVGSAAVVLSSPDNVELGRRETLPLLSKIMGRPDARRVIDAMGRMSKLNEDQVLALLGWFARIKKAAA
ncbi:hypothetical protein [Hypericibacter sp.]|uniref:hypothetical protein n=1 Tax=Hypericibacter sp. TaxID=2705401 RepID=UPI003D6CB1A0